MDYDMETPTATNLVNLLIFHKFHNTALRGSLGPRRGSPLAWPE